MGCSNALLGEIIRFQGERVTMVVRFIDKTTKLPIDLTGATVVLNVATPQATPYLTDKTCTVQSPPTDPLKIGKVDVAFVPTDLATILDEGEAQFTLSYSSPAQVRRTTIFKFTVQHAVNVV